MRKLIVANWKMNCLRAEAAVLSKEIANYANKASPAADIVLCPPYTSIDVVSKNIAESPVMLGAQECHHEESGAYTGDLSAKMLKDAGCDWVIIGHSERRTAYKQSNALIYNKYSAASQAGLTGIFCVGESMQQREDHEFISIVSDQLKDIAENHNKFKNIVIAYEPVWAIGSGLTPTKEQIQQMHEFIHETIPECRVLYGGSANEQNAAEILNIPGVDGLLVGGASLNSERFCTILGG